MINVNEDNWEAEVTNSDKPVLVDFCSQHCGPCQKMTPIMEELSNEITNTKIVKCDVAKLNDIGFTKKFGVRGIPSFVLIRDGRYEKNMTGLIDKDNLKRFFDLREKN